MLIPLFFVSFFSLVQTRNCKTSEVHIWSTVAADAIAFTEALIAFGRAHGPYLVMLGSYHFPKAIHDLRTREKRLSPECAMCFVQNVKCGGESCMQVCMSAPTSERCVTCAIARCNPSLIQCIGSEDVPISPLELKTVRADPRAFEAGRAAVLKARRAKVGTAQTAPTLKKVESWPQISPEGWKEIEEYERKNGRIRYDSDSDLEYEPGPCDKIEKVLEDELKDPENDITRAEIDRREPMSMKRVVNHIRYLFVVVQFFFMYMPYFITQYLQQRGWF